MKNLQNGSALLPFVVVVPFLILIATYSMDLAVTSFSVAKEDQNHTHAQLATDAGIDYSIAQLSTDSNWSGTGAESCLGRSGQACLHNDGQTLTTYQVTVTDINPDEKLLTATGRTFRPVAATNPTSTVKVEVTLRAVSTGGTYSLVTGVGGLYMENSAKIVGGDVQINGEVSLKNTAQIGLSTNPLENVLVAHHNCPLGGGPTYPQACGAGDGEPITIQNQAHIYGDVRANNQQPPEPAMTLPGLTASSGVTPGALPPHDRTAQKNAITTTISGSSASCESSQTRTWDANTKITGDVTVKNSCQVTIGGDIWITGKLTVENSAKLIVSNSLASVVDPAGIPSIMVDGSKALFKNSSLLQSNSSDTGLRVINYWSKASCSPDCTDVTGADLYDSRDETTVELENSASGPESIFYSRWTQVAIQNSGNIGALVGQRVLLKNSGTITFGTSAGGSPSTTWIIDGYRRVFD